MKINNKQEISIPVKVTYINYKFMRLPLINLGVFFNGVFSRQFLGLYFLPDYVTTSILPFIRTNDISMMPIKSYDLFVAEALCNEMKFEIGEYNKEKRMQYLKIGLLKNIGNEISVEEIFSAVACNHFTECFRRRESELVAQLKGTQRRMALEN